MPFSDTLRTVLAVDRVIHEPVRLLIMTYLSLVATADFLFLQRELGLTQGNLSQHMQKLETAGYISVEKTIVQKKTRTSYRLTPAGQQAFAQYRTALTQLMAALPAS